MPIPRPQIEETAVLLPDRRAEDLGVCDLGREERDDLVLGGGVVEPDRALV